MGKTMKKKTTTTEIVLEKKTASSTSGRKRKIFEYCAPSGSQVFIAGDFNNWDITARQLTETNGVFRCILMLAPGTYEYKFYVNGEWVLDNNCNNVKPNNHGSLNSVVVVE